MRCGACRTQFEVPGAGRFACPVCGSVNVVRDAPAAPTSVGGYPAAPGSVPGGATPPPPPPPPPPPKIECPECRYEFFVGQIEVATCPNCAAEVPTGLEPPVENGK